MASSPPRLDPGALSLEAGGVHPRSHWVWRQDSPHAMWVCQGVCVLKIFGERRAGLKQLEGKDRTLAQDFPMAKRAVWGIPANGRA